MSQKKIDGSKIDAQEITLEEEKVMLNDKNKKQAGLVCSLFT